MPAIGQSTNPDRVAAEATISALDPNRAAEQTILSVDNLTLRLQNRPNGPALVDGIGFSVESGRTLCIVGESGCGKSLTALSILGLLPPAIRRSSGTVRFRGVDLTQLSERALEDLRGNAIAMIFQEPMTSLNPAFTVGNQIAEGVMRHKGVSWQTARARALAMLELTRIPAPKDRFNAYPHQLSGGMRQRAMIAMALANDPMLLLADEPTTALDVTIQAQILALIAQLQAETGTALILITHDLGVVAETADDVAVMYAGEIVESGSVADIFADPQHPYTIGLMGSMPSVGPRTSRLATIPGQVPSANEMPAGCRFSPRCPLADTRCRTTRPPSRRFGADHSALCWYAPIETSETAA